MNSKNELGETGRITLSQNGKRISVNASWENTMEGVGTTTA